MIDVRKFEVRSVEELIEALHPIHASAIHADQFEVAFWELRQMKSNVSAVLSFATYSAATRAESDPELLQVVDEVRRECILINGMISRIMFRKRWLFASSKVEDVCEAFLHYEGMTRAACRMCLMVAPELGNNLLSAF
jgi:hypothetical protein